MTIAYVTHAPSAVAHHEIVRGYNRSQRDVYFMTDWGYGDEYNRQICGMQFDGFIIADDALISHDAFLYLMSRIRPRGKLVVAHMRPFYKELMVMTIEQRWFFNQSARNSMDGEDLQKEWEMDVQSCKDLGIDAGFLDKYKEKICHSGCSEHLPETTTTPKKKVSMRTRVAYLLSGKFSSFWQSW